MKKHLTRLGRALGLSAIFAVILGVVAPARAATGGDGDFHFKVVSAAYSYDEATVSIKDETRLTVNGATQLTWWYPNHTVKANAKAIKKAPYIKVKYAPCARQSKSIAKQAHGASLVVAKVGSVICNTGRNGGIVGGFKWKVSKGPAVLQWNKKLKLYEHLFNLILPSNVRAGDMVVGHMKFHGKKYAIVKVCRNRMGGRVDVMYDNVVQVQYAADVQMGGTAEVKTGVHTDVEFGVTCPNGAYFKVKAGGFAYGYASAGITFTERIRASVMNATKVKFSSDSKGSGEVSAVSAARLSLDVSGNCGSTPPADNPPSMQCQGPQHIFVGDDAMYADFDLTDVDGDPVTFTQVDVTGPLQVVLVEDSPISGGKRRTVGVRAGDVPEGQSQNAMLKVAGSAGGKSVSCTVNVIVENSHTGW